MQHKYKRLKNLQQFYKRALIAGTVLSLLFPYLSFAEGLKEPVYPPYCWVQIQNSDLWYPCDSKEAQDANCLLLMETAMTAVDQDNHWRDNSKTMKLWERAKNTCWSTLKDNQPQHYH